MPDTPLFFAYPGNEELAGRLAQLLEGECGRATLRRFPDGEAYVRLDTDPAGRRVVVVATLDRPDDKVLSLVFLSATARELGAASVALVTPYLPYLRQDSRFREGEAVTSRYFAALISRAFDSLVTVDPHLHRYASLGEIYTIPDTVVHTASALGRWIAEHVEQPIVLGPDAESMQWASVVAGAARAPVIGLRKTRVGDMEVSESPPDPDRLRGRTPVLVDDIISTGETMRQALEHARATGCRPPVCVAVHAVFAGDAYARLLGAGAARIVTCNTIAHASNDIDVVPLIAAAMSESGPGGSAGAERPATAGSSKH